MPGKPAKVVIIDRLYGDAGIYSLNGGDPYAPNDGAVDYLFGSAGNDLILIDWIWVNGQRKSRDFFTD